jgi:hypothetical protein
LLFVGDDWAEDKHDVELQNETGRVLARATLREGVDGIARLHAMIGELIGDDDDADVGVAIETDRGPWAGVDRCRLHRVRDQPAPGRPCP